MHFDPELIRRYDMAAPRYTSYPTALSFTEQIRGDQWRAAIASAPSRRLSLYVHIPFCHQLCYYCGCNKVVTRHSHKADNYLEHLAKEIAYQAPLFKDFEVQHLHLGGGTPSFLSQAQMTRLMAMLQSHFRFAPGFHGAIEVDPRALAVSDLAWLAQLGFNRLSIGAQDFNPQVQQAINRVQDRAHIEALMTEARRLGFGSINLDFIYGLPYQDTASFGQTLDQALALQPDRFSIFNYAHLPARFPAQRKLKEETLPSPAEKLRIQGTTIEKLTGAGYRFIGMDHFARKDDELAIAQQEGRLHRNFQGYTTDGDCELLALGVSAISKVGGLYVQNEKDLKAYQQATDSQGHARTQGYQMSEDDRIRAAAIHSLLCRFALDWPVLDGFFGIDSRSYFQEERALLTPFVQDGLLVEEEQGIKITERGRLLVRTIATAFDAHLKKQVQQHRFSRVI
ncbi:oxygen-independent coproporphyrinogen III oxidase [Gallaecimonas kandeliae]|uniref:oxygen-independent coproporphyrinogen III oxidase n=1 Tax=Gallaecimonas kandeliae TaxID=3029055 RepID=UPI002648BA62|nr:oxygen-independent coproporphyrinogen III oxidase [Gallaecimonas kandeliae]WKE65454.1 oxygen-independent coproporphyrinogen III oxidase [Gallaecimonas kandeliae]